MSGIKSIIESNSSINRLKKKNMILKFNESTINSLIAFSSIMLLVLGGLVGQREYTFSQIDLPHNYYFKELYIPQLTGGASSLSWSPDGKSLVFSMSGSLWIQNVSTNKAIQITDGAGYDYQPDWSPEGTHILYVRYDGSAMELMNYNIQTKGTSQLTNNKGINLEPRWSPDGKQIAYVSTAETGHFLLYVAELSKDKLAKIRCLTPDRQSQVKRYYYSAFDHAINPCWTKDGKRIVFVSNKEVAHGTGDLVSLSISNPKDITTIHREETSWRTKPDISPDGSRIIYSSYLGQNWHQLWILPMEGGYPIPLTYEAHDHSQARWSPDGKKIAYISNETGNTSIQIIDIFSGKKLSLIAQEKEYLALRKKLFLTVLDENGEVIPSRMSITDSREKFYGPENAWWHADDSKHPASETFEYRYFHCPGTCEINVPDDSLDLIISHGLNYPIMRHRIKGETEKDMNVSVQFERLQLPEEFGKFWSGDLHVHMNYGGNYRNTPENLVKQAEAEDLNFVYNLIVNKEQRIPDVNYFSQSPDEASTKDLILMHGQEFHTSFWGHMGLLNLNEHLILPDYVGYPYTGVASIFPHNGYVADRAHEQNALVGYVHPFLESEIFPTQSDKLHNALPVDVALGKLDYYEIPSFADPIPTEHVWHQLLNSGLKVPAGGGTDAMANYASLRGPVGVNRVFIEAEGELSQKSIYEGIKAGRGFVTNGPLLGVTIDNYKAGGEISIDSGEVKTLNISASMRSSVPVEHLEIIFNGNVIGEAPITANGKQADFKGVIRVSGSGWITLRAWSEKAHPDLQDFHVYASTNPIYIIGPEGRYQSKSSCEYFIPWIDRIEKEVLAFSSFRSEEERQVILNDVKRARAYYQNCAQSSKNP